MIVPNVSTEDLKELPLRAIVALAARCARRAESRSLSIRDLHDPPRGRQRPAISMTAENFFAPHAGYASDAREARDEFRAMVPPCTRRTSRSSSTSLQPHGRGRSGRVHLQLPRNRQRLLLPDVRRPAGDVPRLERDTHMASAHDETTKTMTEARTDPSKAAPADGPPKPAVARTPRSYPHRCNA